MPSRSDGRIDRVEQMVLGNEVLALRYFCLDYGPAPDGMQDMGLVQLAAAYGYADMLALLLEYRTDTQLDTDMGVFDAPLRLVCATSHTPPDIAETGQNVLEVRVRDYAAVASMLIAAGGNVHSCDRHGRTPLHAAALDGGVEVASCLLEHGARLEQKDHCGRTAMHMAAQQGDSSLVLILLACGADLTVRDNSGSLAAELGVQHRLPPRICKLLNSASRGCQPR